MAHYTKDAIAQAIITEGQRSRTGQGQLDHPVVTERGIVIALATALVESNLTMYANRADPESMGFPHDAVGSDNNSVGVFQQRAPWWGTVADRMDPTRSAALFYGALAKRDYNNPARSPGSYAQSVQQSAFPDRYDQRMAEAQGYYDRLAGGKPNPGPWRGDPIFIPDVLRAEGLECDIYPGAFNRGHGDFGEIWGVIAHHTGSNPPANNPGYIAQHPQLGLASQLHLSRTGKYTLCGVGIAWHAGNGSYPGLPANNANRYTIGIEAENNGVEGWTEAQYTAYVKGVAAILRRLGHDSSRLIGHKEWAGKSQGKWDPGGIDMNAMRRDVQTRIGLGAIDPDTLEEVLMSDELFPSRSTYRTNNDKIMTARDALFNIDSMAHRQLVEDSALRGEAWAVRAVEAVARGEGPGAKLWYDQTKPDTWAIEHAKAILAQIKDS